MNIKKYTNHINLRLQLFPTCLTTYCTVKCLWELVPKQGEDQFQRASLNVSESPIHRLSGIPFMLLLQNMLRCLCGLELLFWHLAKESADSALPHCIGRLGQRTKAILFLSDSWSKPRQSEFMKPCCWCDVCQNIEFLSLTYSSPLDNQPLSIPIL